MSIGRIYDIPLENPPKAEQIYHFLSIFWHKKTKHKTVHPTPFSAAIFLQV